MKPIDQVRELLAELIGGPDTPYMERRPQSEKFAEGLSSALEIPVISDCCIRLKNTQTQTRKTRSERWENVEFAFEVKRRSMIENKRMLLVDDVITTGATLEACGHKLITSGCSELSIACIAEAQ